MMRSRPLFDIFQQGVERIVEKRLSSSMSVRAGESPQAYMSRFDKARTLNLADDKFTMNNSFTIARSCRIRGSGDTTVLDASNAALSGSGYVLKITADNVVVENLRIVGDSIANGIQVTGNDVTIRNVTIESCAKSVVVSGSTGFCVSGCVIKSSVDRAIHVTAASQDGRINDNEIAIPSAAGPPSSVLLDSGVRNVAITGNTVERTGVIEMTNTGGAQAYNAPGAHGNIAVGNSAAVTEHT